MKKEYYVYVLLNPLKRGLFNYGELNFECEPFYVGKGKEDRLNEHIIPFHIKNDSNKLKTNLIKKINREGFNVVSKIVFNDLCENNAFKKEKELISLIGRRDLGFGSLCNLTNGGEGSSGRILSESTKNKIRLKIKNRKEWVGDKNPSKSVEHKKMMSKKLKNRQFSDETKLKMSKSKTGVNLSDEHIKAISEGGKGKKLSKETKLKISSSNSGKIRTTENKISVFINKIDKSIVNKYVEGLIYTKNNINVETNKIMNLYPISRPVINRIKRGIHWINEINNNEMPEIMSKFLDLKDMKLYSSSFNVEKESCKTEEQ